MSSRIQYNNPKSSEALGLPYHYEMVSDASRVGPLKEAIQRTCKGKRVLESGAGSAILSILAAKAGAKKVYAIEIDQDIARHARKNIRKSGYEDIITLIVADVKSITLADIDHEKIDVVIAENLSTWQVTEPQIQIMNHIRSALAQADFIPIPQKIFNNIELGLAQYTFEGVEIRTHFFEFSGVRKCVVLSKKKLFVEVDLTQKNKTAYAQTIEWVAQKSGTLNCVRLTSPLQVFEDVLFDSSDSLMPPIVVPFSSDISVEKGEVVSVMIDYTLNTNWEKFSCEARVMLIE